MQQQPERGIFRISGIRESVETVYRAESRRVFATLVRLLRDFDLAEEAMPRAFAAVTLAVQEPVLKDDEDKRGGVPDNGGTTWWIATRVG